MKAVLSICAVLALAGAANAALSSSQSGPVARTYSNGGGNGFGGTLGSGSITMEVVNGGADLRISFAAAGALNDIVAIMLDTQAGGFADADMRDRADGGRYAVSEFTRELNDVFPDMPSLPDFGLAIGNFGAVLFRLNAGNTDGHLQFELFNGAQDITIPLSLLGSPTQVNWFAGYISGDGYASNESLPASPSINGLPGNPGHGDGNFGGVPGLNEVRYDNYNQYLIPTPGAVALLGLGGLVAGRRRRA
jgi:hypothetical protein